MTVIATAAWKNLIKHAEAIRGQAPRDIYLADAARLEKYDIKLAGLRFNYAFHKATDETLMLLVKLAEQQKIPEWRSRMFLGEKINNTEKRAVLHTALRRTGNEPVMVDGIDVMPEVRATQKRIAAFVDDVRSGKVLGTTGKRFRYIVNIGIGGSDLGPRLAARALAKPDSSPKIYFVANADVFELLNVLSNIDAAETLVVGVSKTFTTQETLLNMHTVRDWLVGQLGEEAVVKHFAAVSVNRAEVEKFGIAAERMFPMWDWVGGRYSLWSAVGLSVALAIGNAAFSAMLAGAEAMDQHFLSAPLAKNMPVMQALLGVWNRNFLGSPELAILPYSERLRDLPRYLQQLEMESNGKSVTRGGERCDYETAPALFGDCGTVGQHSFHQWLHQGTDVIPADFIGVAQDDLGRSQHHRAVLSNLVAQMGALAFGQREATMPQDVYVGGRPSSLLLLDRLDPLCFGSLLALYEHKTFVQGIIWNINSFDQPGVELGKRMAKGLEGAEVNSDTAAQITAKLFSSIGICGK